MSIISLRRRGLAALAVGALFLAACSDDSSSPDSTTETAATAEATAPADTTATVDNEGERIVSLSATATEMLYAIGAQDQIVAVDLYSDYPEAAAGFEPRLDGFEPNVEAIAELEPTVVLAMSDPGNLAEQLAAVDIDVWFGPAATTLDDSYRQITELGELTGKTTEAEAVIAAIKAGVEETVAKIDTPATDLSYFYELDTTYFSLTSNTFVGQLFSLFGAQNIADEVEPGNDYPQLSQEFIVSANPDMIFLADTKYEKQSPETVAARPGWGVIDAVKNGRVIGLNDDIASRWGPRVVDLVKVIGESIAAYAPAG